uniref:Uncharacterized protein n=1 Tax=Solanum lycopersicum TaxID=4081 RepID=A0A3Q7HUW6_SOLLC
MVYKTRNFLVFQIDLDACKTMPTRDLGDQAFFLGQAQSYLFYRQLFGCLSPL